MSIVLLPVVVGVIHHDAVVIKLLAEGLDRLTTGADAGNVLAAVAVVLKSLLVMQTKVVLRDVGFLDLCLLVAGAVVVEVLVKYLDVLVPVGTLTFVLHS